MAIYREDIVDIELKSGNIHRSFLNHAIGAGDDMANRFGVRVSRDKIPETLSGSCVGYFIRADGATVVISDGVISGNKAYVTLPEACYAVEGQFCLAIKLQGNDDTVTMRIVDGTVNRTSTDTIVDPGTIIPSVEDLIDEIEEAVAQIPADYSALTPLLVRVGGSTSNPIDADDLKAQGGWFNSANAGNYSIIHTPYIDGNYYSGWLMVYPAASGSTTVMQMFIPYMLNRLFIRRFRNSIGWTDWEEAGTNNFVKSFAARSNATSNGIAYTWSVYKCAASGTKTDATAVSFNTFYNQANALPPEFSAGDMLAASLESTGTDVVLQIYWYVGGTLDTSLFPVEVHAGEERYAWIPDNASGMLARLAVPANTASSVSETVTPAIRNLLPDSMRFMARGVVPDGTDVSTVTQNGYYFLNGSYDYTDIPADMTAHSGTLEVITGANNLTLQRITRYNSDEIYVRTSVGGAFTTDWKLVSGGTEVTYNMTHYNNTYNVTASPQITADTNNYLAASGTTADRTADIMAMLTANRVCKLGPGDFYVTGIELPINGLLQGCGNRTRIILASSVTEGFAVKMNSYACVKDVWIKGQTTDLTPTSTVGTRHGILFEGSMSAPDPADQQTYYRARIMNTVVTDFTGGGLTCSDTSGQVATAMIVSDCNFLRCGAGINIPYWSEYHRFTNICSQYNYYGCIDNGGNVNFANCDFSKNMVCLLIDKSMDGVPESRNNTHGTFSACSFNHSGSNNDGTAIEITGADNGEIFTGCQIFYGAVKVKNSKGVRFIGANMGRAVPITVTGNDLVTFSDCTVYSSSENPVTASNNTMLRFTECYTLSGAAFSPV